MTQPHPTDDAAGDAGPGEGWDMLAALGVAVEPDRWPAVLAYLAEVRDAADDLLALDLEGTEPGAAFDPRWPEATA